MVTLCLPTNARSHVYSYIDLRFMCAIHSLTHSLYFCIYVCVVRTHCLWVLFSSLVNYNLMMVRQLLHTISSYALPMVFSTNYFSCNFRYIWRCLWDLRKNLLPKLSIAISFICVIMRECKRPTNSIFQLKQKQISRFRVTKDARLVLFDATFATYFPIFGP